MPRGQDTRDHPKRNVSRPKPTPYFELNDSAQRVASDWASGEQSSLGRFASSGDFDKSTFDEINKNLNFGDAHPREKERLTNLKKHLESQQIARDEQEQQ
jgi:hypothetical protein